MRGGHILIDLCVDVELDVTSRLLCKLLRHMNYMKYRLYRRTPAFQQRTLAPQVHRRLVPNFSYIHCSVDEHHPTLTLLLSSPLSVSIEMMCCYPTAGCSRMFWPVCRRDEASALGSERARVGDEPQPLGSIPGVGEPDWLINQSAEVLHSWVSSPLFTWARSFLPSQHRLKGSRDGGGEGRLILTTSTWGFTHGDNCLMSTLLPEFWKTRELKKEKKKA